MRKRHNTFGDHDENSILEDQEVTLWGDSYISLLATSRGKDWFISMILMILVEVFKYGEVREYLFDDHSFLIETDKNRYEWILRLDIDNLTRTMVLCYPIFSEKKRAVIISLYTCTRYKETKKQ